MRLCRTVPVLAVIGSTLGVPPIAAGTEVAPVPTGGSTDWLYALFTAVLGLVSLIVRTIVKHRLELRHAQEMRKALEDKEKDWEEGMVKPVRLPATSMRNSAVLIGLGGTGKTTLIRALLHNPKADPEKKTEEYALYHGERQNDGDPTRFHLYISDYKGQNLGTLIRAFIKQQKIKYSPMAYGFINSLILVVDLFPPKPSESSPEPTIRPSPNRARVTEHLNQWTATALDAIFGLLTSDSLRYVCLFINKADLITSRSEEAEIMERFKPLETLLKERRSGAMFRVYVGSAKGGDKVTHLEEDLRQTAVGGAEDQPPPALPPHSPTALPPHSSPALEAVSRG